MTEEEMEGPVSFWGYKEQESNLILPEHDDDDDELLLLSSSSSSSSSYNWKLIRMWPPDSGSEFTRNSVCLIVLNNCIVLQPIYQQFIGWFVPTCLHLVQISGQKVSSTEYLTTISFHLLSVLSLMSSSSLAEPYFAWQSHGSVFLIVITVLLLCTDHYSHCLNQCKSF